VTEFEALCANDGELATLRASIRDFLAADRATYGWTPAVDCWLAKWDTDFSVRLADAGFVGLTVPTEYGGHGLGYLHRYVVTEELLAHGAPVAAHWIADRQVAPGLLAYGSEEQKRRLLPRIVAGTLYSAIGMSEHGAGSDLAAVSMRAVATDGGWRLSGTKVWTSGAHVAHQIVVLARTSPLDPEHRHAGFSQFIVGTDAAGMTISPIELMNGEHHFNEVAFDDVFVAEGPEGGLLGEIGKGWQQVTAELGFERSGPERILSTATLVFFAARALAERDVDDGTAAELGDLMARMISLRQLSVSVARALSDGEDAGGRAALVKDLGTRFEQDSVELVADLIDGLDPRAPHTERLRGLLATARLHSPLFTLRGGTNEVLRGVVAKGMGALELPKLRVSAANELTQLVDEIGRRSFDARLGRRGGPEQFDNALWRNLEETGLSRLISSGEAGPREAAIVLSGLARHAGAVPIAETDLLAAWLAAEVGTDVPVDGPLTIAMAHADTVDGRITGTAADVPWPHTGPVLLAARTPDGLYVATIDEPTIVDGHTLAGEPRGTFTFDFPADSSAVADPRTGDELARRAAWARCVQILGTCDAAADLTVSHTRERKQFGRPLSAFQAVQHSLAAMAGEIERARAATTLAIAAAADYGFGSPQTDYAVTVAKVAVGRAVEPVTTIAHQLHGAIGVTREHRLWLATMRARSWVDDFGTTAHYARRLGRVTLAAGDPWNVVVSCPSPR
jgi:alkylation response protein AidB-like acyl-CoA dehydrogenase